MDTQEEFIPEVINQFLQSTYSRYIQVTGYKCWDNEYKILYKIKPSTDTSIDEYRNKPYSYDNLIRSLLYSELEKWQDEQELKAIEEYNKEFYKNYIKKIISQCYETFIISKFNYFLFKNSIKFSLIFKNLIFIHFMSD